MTFQDQRVLIIGGSSGMGLATARQAAEQGAAVTITATRNDRLSTALGQLPSDVGGAILDLRDDESIARLFDQIGHLDHLVITAGDAIGRSPVKSTPTSALRALLEVRFWGTVAAVQHAAPRMSPTGSITLTSGTVAARPGNGSAIAAATAAATEGLGRGLAVELAPIRVNVVRPGAIRTPMWDAIPEPQRDAALAGVAHRALTGTVGLPHQIAAAHLLLMSNEFMTGTVLTIDGGALLAS